MTKQQLPDSRPFCFVPSVPSGCIWIVVKNPTDSINCFAIGPGENIGKNLTGTHKLEDVCDFVANHESMDSEEIRSHVESELELK